MKCSTRLVLSRVLMRMSESRLCGRARHVCSRNNKTLGRGDKQEQGDWGVGVGSAGFIGSGLLLCKVGEGESGVEGAAAHLRDLQLSQLINSCNTDPQQTDGQRVIEPRRDGTTVRSALPMPGPKNITTIDSFSEQELHPTKAEESQKDKWRSSEGGNTA